MSIGSFFEAVGGTAGGLGTALGAAYLIAGSVKKRRIARGARASQERDSDKDWNRWRDRVEETLEGRLPSSDRPGFHGVIHRVDRLEIAQFGHTQAAIEPTGKGGE